MLEEPDSRIERDQQIEIAVSALGASGDGTNDAYVSRSVRSGDRLDLLRALQDSVEGAHGKKTST